MTIPSPPISFTPEDLLNLEKDGLYELVDGKLVQKPMSFLANVTAVIVARRLGDFVDEADAGAVASEQTFQCFAHDPNCVRIPDIAFIAATRVPRIADEGHVKIPPDIAIEIISPGNRINDFEEKLVDYRKAAIPLVWEVNPKLRFVRVHYLDRPPVRLEESDTLNGDPVLPSFAILVRDLLPPVPSNT